MEITNYGHGIGFEGDWACKRCGATWTMETKDTIEKRPVYERTENVDGVEKRLYKFPCPVCNLLAYGPEKSTAELEAEANPVDVTTTGTEPDSDTLDGAAPNESEAAVIATKAGKKTKVDSPVAGVSNPVVDPAPVAPVDPVVAESEGTPVVNEPIPEPAPVETVPSGEMTPPPTPDSATPPTP